MRRFSSFLFGVLVGGALVFFGQRYHVVRTSGGFELIPKISAGFVETYVDVRGFQAADWEKHKDLSAAIVQAKKESIMGASSAASGTQGIKAAPADPKRQRAI